MFQANPLIADRLRWLNESPANVVVADNAELVGNAGLPRETDRRRHARIRHRNDHVGLGRSFACKFRPHRLAHVVDVTAANDGVGP